MIILQFDPAPSMAISGASYHDPPPTPKAWLYVPGPIRTVYTAAVISG